jgi:ABC-type multidrug transport system permease subunit
VVLAVQPLWIRVLIVVFAIGLFFSFSVSFLLKTKEVQRWALEGVRRDNITPFKEYNLKFVQSRKYFLFLRVFGVILAIAATFLFYILILMLTKPST